MHHIFWFSLVTKSILITKDLLLANYKVSKHLQNDSITVVRVYPLTVHQGGVVYNIISILPKTMSTSRDSNLAGWNDSPVT